MIKINRDVCTGCGGCIDLCPVMAISMVDDKPLVDNETCTECEICVKVCPVNAPGEVA